MLALTMLPANEGDGLLLSYGDPARPRRVLVDLGRGATYPKLLNLLGPDERHFELFVISHVDRDHIEGALALLADNEAGFSFGDIWFNGYAHLDWQPGVERFGAAQGERLTELIRDRNLPWNEAFGGGPVRVEAGGSVTRHLPGGLVLHILSPDAAKLAALEPVWEKECRAAGIQPGAAAEERPPALPSYEQFGGSLEELAELATPEDRAPANGSSIALLVEYAGRKILLAADAHPSLLTEGLKAMGGGTPVALDLMKVSHHGSRANTTLALLAELSCRNFLLSTSGAYFNHPDREAIARLLVTDRNAEKKLHFNYRQPKTTSWDESASQKRLYAYSCHYPAEGEPLTIILEDRRN